MRATVSQAKSIAVSKCGVGMVSEASSMEAYASTDLSDEEAGAAMAGIGLNHRDPDVRGARAQSLAMQRKLEPLLVQLDGRFVTGLSDKRDLLERTLLPLAFPNRDMLYKERSAFQSKRRRFGRAVRIFLEPNITVQATVLDGILASRDPMALLHALRDHLDEDEDIAAYFAANLGEIADGMERFRPPRLRDVEDVDADLGAIHAHCDHWGRRHRLITPVSSLQPVAMAVAPSLNPAFTYGPMVHESFWKAWRQSGPVAFQKTESSAALQLAHLIGAVTIMAHEHPDADCRHLASAIERNHYGQRPPNGAYAEACEHQLHLDAEEDGRRDTLWNLEYESGGALTSALRIASRIGVHDVRSSRDRFLAKMTGRGLDMGAILTLRIEDLDVTRHGDLIKRYDSEKVPVYQMDGDDRFDFWTLVRACEGTAGFLFSPFGDREPYGRNPLTRSAFEDMMETRATEFPERETAVAPTA